MNVMVSPSILSADFSRLGEEIDMLNESAADWIHCDVMDGRFVPNITFGFPVIRAVRKVAKKPLDVHLMIVEPERYVDEFARAGAHVLTVHLESSPHLHRTIFNIKERNMMASVAINPHSPVSLLQDVIADLDMVCVMSVNPGFGGQKFIHNTFQKLSQLKNLILSRNSKALIEIDGGVDLENAEALAKAGADVLVAGHSIFSTRNPVETIALLKNARKNIVV